MKCSSCDKTLYLGKCPEHGEILGQVDNSRPASAQSRPPASETNQPPDTEVDDKPATDADVWTWEQAGHIGQRLVRRLGARIRQDAARIAELEAELDRRSLAIERLGQQVSDWRLRAMAAETQLASIAKGARHAAQ